MKAPGIRSILFLVAVLGQVGTVSVAQAGTKVANLELFAAESNGEGEQGLRFLQTDPLTLEIENYQLEESANSVWLTLSDRTAEQVQKLTAAYLEKRLAIVVDGVVTSAPVIKAPITGNSLAISFSSRSELDAFIATLE